MGSRSAPSKGTHDRGPAPGRSATEAKEREGARRRSRCRRAAGGARRAPSRRQPQVRRRTAAATAGPPPPAAARGRRRKRRRAILRDAAGPNQRTERSSASSSKRSGPWRPSSSAAAAAPAAAAPAAAASRRRRRRNARCGELRGGAGAPTARARVDRSAQSGRRRVSARCRGAPKLRAGGQGEGRVRGYSEIEVREKRGEHLASSTRRAQSRSRASREKKKRSRALVRGRLGHAPAGHHAGSCNVDDGRRRRTHAHAASRPARARRRRSRCRVPSGQLVRSASNLAGRALPCRAAAAPHAHRRRAPHSPWLLNAIAIRTLRPPIWCGDLGPLGQTECERGYNQRDRTTSAAASGGRTGRAARMAASSPPRTSCACRSMGRRRSRRRSRRRFTTTFGASAAAAAAAASAAAAAAAAARARRVAAAAAPGAEAVAGDEAEGAAPALGRLPSDQRRVGGLGLRSGGHALRALLPGEGRRRARGTPLRGEEATISGLTPGTAYRFSVSVASASGELEAAERAARHVDLRRLPAVEPPRVPLPVGGGDRAAARPLARLQGARDRASQSCPRRRATRRGSPSGSRRKQAAGAGGTRCDAT